MGVLDDKRPSNAFVVAPTFFYALLVFTTAWRHEPWADEAQAWLLARDSSFRGLLHQLHYEGTPGLWHAVLFALIQLHFPYAALNHLSGTLGAVSAYLIFRFAPFATPIRLALPFTYFLAYQYSVVARSYSLLAPLLFGLAAAYPARRRRPLLYAMLLSAAALTSTTGLVLSFLIAATAFRHRLLIVYAFAAAIAVWCAWPAPDVTFVRRFNYSTEHLTQVTRRLLATAFTGEWITAALAIAASFPFLARGRSLLFFVLAALSLTVLASVVYGQVWHFGFVFVAWIFACWLAGLRARPGWLACTALAATLSVQCFWTARTVVLDWQTAYSGGLETARYLKARGIPEAGLFALGYAPVAVQPYFDRNIYLNFDHSFWDWSSRNHMIADYANLRVAAPPWVLVGYKTQEENRVWNGQVLRSGYRKVKHFEGNAIWQGRPFEPESFDLYRRP